MEEQMYKLILVGLVLLFTFAVICRSIYVLIKRGKVFGESSTKLIGLTVVVGAALIVCILDCDNGAVFALLGTIAGYFLGQKRPKEDKDDK
jgi:hypothetical protein